ncbi:MAG: glycerate kinase type-2 family protein [Candidatus Helarchaeota archaeon]
MFIQNRQELLSITDPKIRKLRNIIIELLEVGLESLKPSNLISNSIDFDNIFRLDKFNNIYVIGAGKASGSLAEEVEKRLKTDKFSDGLVIVPRGLKDKIEVHKIKILEADHPIPTNSNINASVQLLKFINSIQKEKGLIIVLITGGGSALLTLPPKGINLNDIRRLTDLLLKSGADIREINVVRKHIDEFKGGLLVKKLFPATVISLLVSDVGKHPPEFIASGPTFPDQSKYQDAMNILRKYNLLEKIPSSILEYLKKGVKGLIQETPKKHDKIFSKTQNYVIGSSKIICNAIFDEAKRRNIVPFKYPKYLEGEARDSGKKIIDFANNIYQNIQEISKPLLFIASGEPTVTLKGSGLGGRCQELVLGSLEKVARFTQAVMAAIGTDGIDGYSDAAGAICDSNSFSVAKSMGLDIKKFLENNDSYNFFKKMKHNLIFTGPTGINVSDIILILLS